MLLSKCIVWQWKMKIYQERPIWKLGIRNPLSNVSILGDILFLEILEARY